MVDITLIVISKSTKFDVTKVAGQWQRGDIFDGVSTSTLGRAAPNPKRNFVWIHITGVPITAIQKAKFLTKHYWDPLLNEWEAPMLSRRRWRGLLDDLPVGIKDKLRDEGQVTVTWEQAKPFIWDHVDGRTVTDGDMA